MFYGFFYFLLNEQGPRAAHNLYWSREGRECTNVTLQDDSGNAALRNF